MFSLPPMRKGNQEWANVIVDNEDRYDEECTAGMLRPIRKREGETCDRALGLSRFASSSHLSPAMPASSIGASVPSSPRCFSGAAARPRPDESRYPIMDYRART
jgi:hypothetical protein